MYLQGALENKAISRNFFSWFCRIQDKLGKCHIYWGDSCIRCYFFHDTIWNTTCEFAWLQWCTYVTMLLRKIYSVILQTKYQNDCRGDSLYRAFTLYLYAVVKLLNQRWWIPVFQRNSNTIGDIRVYQLLETLRVHTHSTSFFKVPYHKSVKQKNDLVPWSACNG